MSERVTMIQEQALAGEGSESSEPGLPPDSLEQRVHRLEDAVAAIQDTRLLEARVLERVLQESAKAAPPARPPAAQQVFDSARFKPQRPSPPPVAAPVAPRPASAPSLQQAPWLLLELAAELRAMCAMFFDRSYRTGWTTRLALFVLVPLIVLSHWWFPFAWVPIIGPIVDKLADLVLAFFLYKALAREASRYRNRCL
jgi:hypothetical protein